MVVVCQNPLKYYAKQKLIRHYYIEGYLALITKPIPRYNSNNHELYLDFIFLNEITAVILDYQDSQLFSDAGVNYGKYCGWGGIFAGKKSIETAAFDRLNVAATLKEHEIARWFEDKQRDFLQTTQMPDIQSNLEILLNSDNRKNKQEAYLRLERYLTRINQIKPSLREIFILDRMWGC